MNGSDIRSMIAAGESATLELQRGADPKRLGPALAAFANSNGGVLILGVEDDGRI